MLGHKAKTNIMRFFIYAILIILVVICIVPVWMLIVNATRSTAEIQQGISLLPSNNLDFNWNTLTSRGFNIGRGFVNSSVIAVSATLLTVYFSMMTAYALQVYKFKYRKALYAVILVLVLLPTQQVGIIGFRQHMFNLGLLDSYIPLILPAIAAPPAVFFAKQYLESCVSMDLIQAARIDGCSELGIFHRVMLPIAAPGAFTLGLFSFVAAWNNFFTPYMILNKVDMFTLPQLVRLLRGDTYRTEYGGIYLGLAVTVLPIIVVYAICSKYIISGISMGALKE